MDSGVIKGLGFERISATAIDLIKVFVTFETHMQPANKLSS